MGTAIWCPRAQVSLNLKNQDLDRQNLSSMLKISYAAFPVYLHWFRHNSLLKCVLQLKIAKKSIKTNIFAFKGIQGHWIRWQSRASVRLPISD